MQFDVEMLRRWKICIKSHHRLGTHLHVDALLGQQVKALGLDLGHEVGAGPGGVRRGPVSGGAAPDAATAEGRRDLHHVALLDSQLHLRGVGDHLDDVAVAALVHGLGHQRLEPGADLPGGEVAGGRDELHP